MTNFAIQSKTRWWPPTGGRWGPWPPCPTWSNQNVTKFMKEVFWHLICNKFKILSALRKIAKSHLYIIKINPYFEPDSNKIELVLRALINTKSYFQIDYWQSFWKNEEFWLFFLILNATKIYHPVSLCVTLCHFVSHVSQYGVTMCHAVSRGVTQSENKKWI